MTQGSHGSQTYRKKQKTFLWEINQEKTARGLLYSLFSLFVASFFLEKLTKVSFSSFFVQVPKMGAVRGSFILN